MVDIKPNQFVATEQTPKKDVVSAYNEGKQILIESSLNGVAPVKFDRTYRDNFGNTDVDALIQHINNARSQQQLDDFLNS